MDKPQHLFSILKGNTVLDFPRYLTPAAKKEIEQTISQRQLDRIDLVYSIQLFMFPIKHSPKGLTADPRIVLSRMFFFAHIPGLKHYFPISSYLVKSSILAANNAVSC